MAADAGTGERKEEPAVDLDVVKLMRVVILGGLGLVALWGLLWLLLRSFEGQFRLVWGLDLVRRFCYLPLGLVIPYALSAIFRGEWSVAASAVAAGALLLLVIRYGDIATEQFLYASLLNKGSGESGPEEQGFQRPRSPEGLTNEQKAASAMLTLSLRLRDQTRFPERIFNKLNQREPRTFWRQDDLFKFKQKEALKGFLFTAAQF